MTSKLDMRPDAAFAFGKSVDRECLVDTVVLKGGPSVLTQRSSVKTGRLS
ncbi:hypothetical protein [Rhodoplanes sp. SY1]